MSAHCRRCAHRNAACFASPAISCGPLRTMALGTSSENRDLSYSCWLRPRKSPAFTSCGDSLITPLNLSKDTCCKLGFIRTVKIGLSYLYAAGLSVLGVRGIARGFLCINRFGGETVLTFFKSYTEKVWGVPCEEISAEWGAQRIKGLSVRTCSGFSFQEASSREDEASGRNTRDLSD